MMEGGGFKKERKKGGGEVFASCREIQVLRSQSFNLVSCASYLKFSYCRDLPPKILKVSKE